MKVVIFCGGKGVRLRQGGADLPKPMVRLAGRPILGHLLEWAVDDRVDEVILIISPHHTEVEGYAPTATSRPLRIVVQDEPRGQADAIA